MTRRSDSEEIPSVRASVRVFRVVVRCVEVRLELRRQREAADQVPPDALEQNEATHVLQRLDLLEARDGMQQLDTHRSDGRRSVQEEEEATASRVLNRVFDEVDDGVAAELVQATEAEVTCPHGGRGREGEREREEKVRKREGK